MLRPATTPPHLITLIFATALSVVTLNLFLPGLPAIAEEFDASYATVSLSLSGYFLVTAVVQLFAGPLSDRYGRRPVILGGLALFFVASVGCLRAESIESFLFWRVLQAAVASGAALSMAVVRDTVPEREAARRIGLIGMAMALGPMVAPLIGGLLGEAFGWRASFALYAALGFGLLLLVWADLGETNGSRGRPLREQMADYPRLLRDGRFWGYAATSALSLCCVFVVMLGAPTLGEAESLSQGAVGLALAVTPVGYIVGTGATTRLARHFPGPRLILLGRFISMGGMVLALVLAVTGVPLALYFGCFAAIGIGNGLTLPAAYSGAMSVRPELAGSAASLVSALNVIVGAVVTAAAGAMPAVISDRAGLALVLVLICTGALAAGLFTRRIVARTATA
ncbi:Bcr/CflA family efflux MFS transporter [Pontivivens ytuae]|uniref:Bcr/CflA family efflux transporter n=1 Tax=Pontivivens ytuae TaxID=2789856 RepID=A0A7S9LT20_9RHOB|nr:Bcr/CflA family efflux MFS transporter [Pontivivens ytuae]QPH54774.1 Bcr/CflA family efflux MFS transporter [Pontivivens ytuae]